MRNKKGVSELISYVILITIVMSISTLVYVWLRGQVDTSQQPTCPEGTNLIIEDYTCRINKDSGGLDLNLTIRNKGLFPVDGFLIKVNDKLDSAIGVYTLQNDQANSKLLSHLEPGKSVNFKFNLLTNAYKGAQQQKLTKIYFIEVQPFINATKGDFTFCGKVSSQITACSST